jgi:hypothetical protein
MLESFPESARRLRDVLNRRSEQSLGEMFAVRNVLDEKNQKAQPE